MERSEKRALWKRLVDEARESKTCVVCLEPLRHVTNRAPVKCLRPECKRGYHSLYRRLGRRDVVAS
jgi:hypothetical protein